jgi:hypothetical protein
MNHVYTNEFVGDVSTLGHGTYFGVVKGLNGQWAWYNIQSEKNPDNKIGNFKGVFEIVPKPEARAVYATSFVYRRCAQPLKSLCPAENANINPHASSKSAKIVSVTSNGGVHDLVLDGPVVARAGDSVTWGTNLTGIVVASPTLQTLSIQPDAGKTAPAAGNTVTVGESAAAPANLED